MRTLRHCGGIVSVELTKTQETEFVITWQTFCTLVSSTSSFQADPQFTVGSSTTNHALGADKTLKKKE